jgi:ornithine cyclodeaminase/alanine dehydrogenase-like protein (mu-crystallin family)
MLAAVAHVRRLPRVKVYSPNPAHRHRFAAEMEHSLGVPVVAVDRPDQAVRGCDLVLSAYRAGREPMISAAWLDPGTHLNAASSVRPEAREIEDEVWSKCTRVVVDDRDHVFESGDGRSALAENAIRRDDTLELWQVAGGGVPARCSEADITLFKSVGTALQDLALAAAIYRRARERGLGIEIGGFPHVR